MAKRKSYLVENIAWFLKTRKMNLSQLHRRMVEMGFDIHLSTLNLVARGETANPCKEVLLGLSMAMGYEVGALLTRPLAESKARDELVKVIPIEVLDALTVDRGKLARAISNIIALGYSPRYLALLCSGIYQALVALKKDRERALKENEEVPDWLLP